MAIKREDIDRYVHMATHVIDFVKLALPFEEGAKVILVAAASCIKAAKYSNNITEKELMDLFNATLPIAEAEIAKEKDKQKEKHTSPIDNLLDKW